MMPINWKVPRFTEQYDKEMVKLLCNIGHNNVADILRTRGFDIEGENSNVREQTERIRNLAQDAVLCGKLGREVVYKYSKKNPTDGRLYPNKPCLQNICCCFRGVLSGTTAIDFDAINCFPVLLLSLCRKHKIYCPMLEKYTCDREEMLMDFCNEDDISRSEAKTFFLKSIHKETRLRKKDKKINITYKKFIEFDNEMKCIQRKLIVEYQEEYAKIQRREEYNYNGKFMARLLNIEENKMLQCACDAIHQDYPVMTLVFDGMMVYRYKDGVAINENNVIDALNKSTKEWGIEWSVKEPDLSIQEYIETEINLDSGAILYAKTEAELVNKMFNEFFNYKLYKSKGQPYLLENHKWETNVNQIQDAIYKTVISTKGYVMKNNESDKPTWDLMTQKLNGAKSISDATYKFIPENSKFLDELERRCLYKLSFNNGYWDFKKGYFVEYEDEDGYDTIHMIDRDFKYIEKDDPLRKEVYDTIIYKMFCVDDESSQDFPVMENFLHHMGRSMAGITSDKIWFMLEGERDSAKGVFDGLLRNAFGSYIGNFNSSAFDLDTKNVNDPELKQKFLLKNRYCRMAASQETSDKWKDGDLIKKMSSGGDTIEARNLYEHTVSFINPCKYMFVGNNSARVKPSDALKTQWYYKMKCKFVDNPEKDAEYATIRYYQSDCDIKEVFIRRDGILNAFCSILFDYYERKDTNYPEILKPIDVENINVDQETKMLFDFTMNDDDVLPNSSIKELYGSHKDIYDSCGHLKKTLMKLGAKNWRTKNVRGLKRVTTKIDNEDDE